MDIKEKIALYLTEAKSKGAFGIVSKQDNGSYIFYLETGKFGSDKDKAMKFKSLSAAEKYILDIKTSPREGLPKAARLAAL